jgi:SM-20-related protein
LKAGVTTKLGIYTEEDFLDRATCEALKAEARAGACAPASVYGSESGYVLDEARRSAFKVSVSDGAAASVRERLLAKRGEFTARFGVEVKDCQEPTFLLYKPGDFFETHRDRAHDREAPDAVRRRRVSVVVFLNDEAAGGAAGEYEGGSLAFYGLLRDPRCWHLGVPVRGKAGLLVAFNSDIFHQVSPVTKGERLTIVSWFF